MYEVAWTGALPPLDTNEKRVHWYGGRRDAYLNETPITIVEKVN